jgi:DUF3071 family protein
VRKLHLVGFTPDRKGLIFSARRGSKSGGFLVPLEDSLLESLAAEQRRRNGPDTEGADTSETPEPSRAGRPQSTLTPREMQARLRAGRTIAEVAAEAGVPTDWVERFAIPILAEQAQMVELARSLTYSRSRGGESAMPLGASVAENLAYRGVALPEDLFDNAWSAYQLHDVVWIVRVRYRSRGRLQEAAWEVDVRSGHLTARNRLASELAFVEKGRRRKARRSPSSAPPEAAVPTPARAAAGRPPAAARRKTTPPAAAPPAAKRATTRPAASKRAASKRATSKRATTKRATTKRTATKRTATKRAATKRAATKRAATKRVATQRAPAARTAVPPRVRVGTDGTPSPPASGRVVSPTSAARGGSHPDGGPPDGSAGSRSSVNRLAASRVTAIRAAAGRLRGDHRPANPVPPEERVAPPRTPPQSRNAVVRPTDGGRAAMADTPPPSSLPIALSAAPPPTAASPAAPPPPDDTDFELDDLLEPAPRVRPLRRAAGSGRLSPWPIGTS